MPVIIEAGNRERWLDRDDEDAPNVTGLLVPSPEGTLMRYPISRDVNNVRSDGPQIISRQEKVEAANA